MIWNLFLAVMDAAEHSDQSTLKHSIDEFNRAYRRLNDNQQGAFHAGVAEFMKSPTPILPAAG